MKAVFLLFDSLNRHLLGPYGGTDVPTPNFDRLAARSVVFDKHYVGSMPCMPARRDMMTGRLSFLHRSWGPLEPFDNAFPELLQEAGVHSHLVTDHYHYWEDGGATYHNRYTTFEFVRGQEADPWKVDKSKDLAELSEKYHPRQRGGGVKHVFEPYIVNREFIAEEEEFPAYKTFAHGLDFLARNHGADNWLLQIETFDPHEPFHAPDRFKDAFRTGWNGPVRDWPTYGRGNDEPGEADELRANYRATLAHCDHLLGKLLDAFDEYDLWKDTALVLTTDHGFLLGEHDLWAKNRMTMYQEIANIPLFIHDPRTPRSGRVGDVTQSIDIAPTLLALFGLPPAEEMKGRSLAGEAHHDAVIFGYFGGAVNITDGTYTYHRYPEDIRTQEIYQYTLMPTHLKTRFTPEELREARLHPPFDWTKDVPLLQIPVQTRSPFYMNYGPGSLIESDTRLYDVGSDPSQARTLDDPETEARLVSRLVELMEDNDAPPEAYRRIGLQAPERIRRDPA
jgi:arylsulfatase A-like enzyme